MKNADVLKGLFMGLAGLVLGLFLVTVSASSLLGMLSKIVGVFLIIVNLPGIINGIANVNDKLGRAEFVSSVIGAVIGIVMVFLTATALKVVMVIAGIWFLVLPIFDIICSPYRKEQFKVELPKIIIGIMLIVLGPLQAIDIIFMIIGWIIIVLSALVIIRNLIEAVKK